MTEQNGLERSSSTDELRRLLDERGVEYFDGTETTLWGYEPTSESTGVYRFAADETSGGRMQVRMFNLTPEQAVEATLGRGTWVDPAWERWHKSLRHDEIKSIGDAVEQLMYEAIEFGGDMGPNGNTYNGIDEGDVLTAGFINEWVKRFESTLGRDRYSYGQWREISNAVGDAMEYAHDRAIEHPDAADPLWNLDEYVNRILKVAFEGEATLGSDLEAENEKLRERIHELEMEGSDHFYRTAYAEDANRTLEAENAKLRELVDYMTPIAWYAASERERDRMRELGVDR